MLNLGCCFGLPLYLYWAFLVDILLLFEVGISGNRGLSLIFLLFLLLYCHNMSLLGDYRLICGLSYLLKLFLLILTRIDGLKYLSLIAYYFYLEPSFLGLSH